MIKLPSFKTRHEAKKFVYKAYKRHKPFSYFIGLQQAGKTIENEIIRNSYLQAVSDCINGFKDGKRKPTIDLLEKIRLLSLYKSKKSFKNTLSLRKINNDRGPQRVLTEEDRIKRLEHEKENARRKKARNESGEKNLFMKIIYTPMGGMNKK